jgi:hypothetical protein
MCLSQLSKCSGRYMGTITGISGLDPVRWPNSHWRSVKVDLESKLLPISIALSTCAVMLLDLYSAQNSDLMVCFAFIHLV